jgi:DMSO/TMAO reductase YedYZ heme-binding membrane subunit
MLPLHQIGIWAGIVALVLMTPAALTSFDRLQITLGKHWRQIHLLSVPALVLAAVHTVLIGSHYLGDFEGTWVNKVMVAIASVLVIGVLLIRLPIFWSLFSLRKFYIPPNLK